MSVTVELSELDAFLWDAFRRGGEWVAASEYRKLMAENAELRESLEYANNEWEKESMEYLSTQDQNAKLRELVRIVVNKYCESGTCDGCPILGKDESCPY